MDQHTLFVRPPVWALLLAVAIGGSFYIYGKKLEVRDAPLSTITVSGEGKVFVAPDIAEMTFGIQTGRQPTAAAAMKKLKDGMDKIFTAVKAAGIPEKDISTAHFWLNPVYDWTDGGQIFRGFEANQSLQVKVRDLDKVSAVLEAATNAGANQAGNVQFTVDDPEAKRSEARAKAITQAKAKAKELADQLGERLGDVQSFTEGGGGWAAPMMMRGEALAMDAATKEASLPLPAGEQEIISSVTITYELQ
jgi:uncharacterized protein YggE